MKKLKKKYSALSEVIEIKVGMTARWKQYSTEQIKNHGCASAVLHRKIVTGLRKKEI